MHLLLTTLVTHLECYPISRLALVFEEVVGAEDKGQRATGQCLPVAAKIYMFGVSKTLGFGEWATEEP